MKHKMWSRLLSMMLAVMMIASIVPNSAFAEAASEIVASSQAVAEVVEETEEVTLPEETTGEEPAEQPAGEPAPTAEPVAEPTAEPVTESEQPAAEPTQAPAETAVPSEQPSAEPSAAPEATETPNASAQPSETPAASATPAPSESPVPSETPAPSETPEATEEPVAMNEEAYEATAQVENADITVTVKVPEGALPVDAELKAELIGEETAEFAQVEQALAEGNVEYDGMIALDIRFEVNGEEIEPLYPVEVTIDAKAMLPEDADPETVAVQHLEENENGEVTAVKTVADATESTGHVVVEETEEATMDMVSTFTVEGFSPYAVTYARWPGHPTDWGTINPQNKETVHFYVNLHSTIANSEAGAGDTEAENFTTSVFQTSIKQHPRYFNYEPTNGEYIVIQGKTDGSAFDVDQDIRSLKDGYYGANKRGEDTPFQLANFPTDKEIFDTIKSNWDEYTKNKGIKINGIDVEQSELTTQKYAIRWYVFKLNDSDFWHIDGILVPRYGQLTVTKTFQNANQILNEIEQDFEISVKGRAGQFVQSYSLRLSEKSSSDQSGVLGYNTKTTDGNSTTYTWVFDVLDADYTIEESGGDVDQWISSATYRVTKGDQTTESVAYPPNGFPIKCDVWGSDEQKETQSVELINTYEQVLTTLTLTKEFDGLTDEDVYYLLFNQKGGTDKEEQFAFDINYCSGTEVVSSKTNPEEWNRIKKFATKPNGASLTDSGGDFKVYPYELLSKVDTSSDLAQASNSKLGAKLEKNEKTGNWVYTQEIEVPICGEGCYYTVFEQHAELPGYAKQGAKSTNWTVVSEGFDFSGVGKAVRKNSESSGDAAIDEEDMLDKKEFQELEIKSPTTVSFTNRYTGNMTIEKEVKGVPAGTAGLEDATYTIVIEPAHPGKLVDSANHGPSFAGKSFTLIKNSASQTMTFDRENKATITLKAGETVTLENLPAIQYKITENTTNMAQIGDYVFKNESMAETYRGNVSDELEHWNQYDRDKGDEITGKTNPADGIVAVDVDRNITPVSSVTVTNLYEKATGTLIIKKTVTGLENDSKALNELKGELSFAISGPEGYANQTIQASDTSKVQWDDAVATITLSKVPVGSYTVTESGYNAVEGYIWQEATITASGIVAKDETTTLELKNGYTPANGDLLISKTLTGINTTMGNDVTFIFEITGPTESANQNQKTYYRYLTFSKDDFKTAQDDGSVTKQVWLKDVPVGAYTVTELKAAGYTCNDNDTLSGVVTSSEVTDAQVKFTNNPVADDPTPGDQDFVENRFNWNAETKQWVWVQANENQNEKGSN